MAAVARKGRKGGLDIGDWGLGLRFKGGQGCLILDFGFWIQEEILTQRSQRSESPDAGRGADAEREGDFRCENVRMCECSFEVRSLGSGGISEAAITPELLTQSPDAGRGRAAKGAK